LFEVFGSAAVKKIRSHHEENGGVSRYEKLPIYLEWLGQHPSQVLIDEYAERFSVLVKQKVIESDWVLGVLDYLERYSRNKTFFLVTATPQTEIEEILIALKIQHYFCRIIGAPIKKEESIRMLLTKYLIEPNQAVMIGDSNSDYDAASANHVPFVLRRTYLNLPLQEKLNCTMIDDFCDE